MNKIMTIALLAIMSLGAFNVQAAVMPATPHEQYEKGEAVKVLIVPGHDAEFSGAVFNGTKEADMNVVVAKKLAAELSVDPKLSVTLARDENGYDAELQDYFDDNEKPVQKFIETKKRSYERAVKRGSIDIPEVQVPHGDAPSTVAYRLYAINKWADESGYDMVIHVHFNDYGGRKITEPGEYRGFSIYTPGAGLPNAAASMPLAQYVGISMEQSMYTSDMPSELTKINPNGVIPDLKLIAMGSYGTLSIPSILVEYAYIYEPQVQSQTFEFVAGVYARATANGVFEYLANTEQSNANLRYQFAQPMREAKNMKEQKMSQDVLALQLGLRELGLFPGTSDRYECAIDGIFSACTKTALMNFQAKKGLTADGVAGPKTLAALNQLFK